SSIFVCPYTSCHVCLPRYMCLFTLSHHILPLLNNHSLLKYCEIPAFQIHKYNPLCHESHTLQAEYSPPSNPACEHPQTRPYARPVSIRAYILPTWQEVEQSYPSLSP